jgi:hypothetical protein
MSFGTIKTDFTGVVIKVRGLLTANRLQGCLDKGQASIRYATFDETNNKVQIHISQPENRFPTNIKFIPCLDQP